MFKVICKNNISNFLFIYYKEKNYLRKLLKNNKKKLKKQQKKLNVKLK